MNVSPMKTSLFLSFAIVLAARVTPAAEPNFDPAAPPTQDAGAQPGAAANAVPDLTKMLSPRESEMKLVITRYEADRDKLGRFFSFVDANRFTRMQRFYADWLVALGKLDQGKLTDEARADHKRLVEEINKDRSALEAQAQAWVEIAPAMPFAATIISLGESQLRMEKPDAEKAALTVDGLKGQIEAARKGLDGTKMSKAAIRRAADTVNSLKGSLRNWYQFYYDYDPMFTWWVPRSYKEVDQALAEYITFLRDKAGDDAADATATPPALTNDQLLKALPKPTASIAAEDVSKMAGDLAIRGSYAPDLNELLMYPQSEMRGIVQRYQGGGGRGGGGGGRRGGGGGRGAVTKQYYDDWLAALAKLNFDSMSRNAQVDYLLLKNRIESSRDALSAPRANAPDETARFLPFQTTLTDLARRQGDKPNAAESVTALKGLKEEIDAASTKAEADLAGADGAALKPGAAAAARALNGLQGRLKDWHDANAEADVKWVETAGDAYKATDQALEAYAAKLSAAGGPVQRGTGSDLATVKPIGHDALMVLLKGEMIDYTPEELITRAEKEYAWCEAEMKKASRKMGFGDDWRKAVEKVKTEHVPAGDQPYEIRDLMWEAIDYIQKHDMITIPEVARETLREEMMSPQRQLVNPFFTGGELISVSYPTSTMETDAREQSMRGNNIHFARATVFHELLPGHNLQSVMQQRMNGYRRGFGTPFWGEGWACYWELLLYQEGFPKSPENRIGMLFWRMHRCARIMFSLNYHLGKWTPEHCVDFLVDAVGHERENAAAEVRRSFGTGYGPLYQCAYLLGAMQLLELHKELVESGKMTERAFHDAIIQGGSMPIAMVRASLTKEKLTADYKPNWKF
jgi:uncharacterized protein (DUF885 family)